MVSLLVPASVEAWSKMTALGWAKYWKMSLLALPVSLIVIVVATMRQVDDQGFIRIRSIVETAFPKSDPQ